MNTRGVARYGLNLAVLLLVVLGGYSLSHHFVRLTVVHGTSMLPMYKDGDLLISTPQARYEVGDVVTYHPSDLPCDLCNVVHRIIRGSDSGWITQGDNNLNLDAWKPTSDQISGKVVMHMAMPPLAKIAYQPALWFTLLFGCISMHYYRRWLKEREVDEQADQESPQALKPESEQPLVDAAPR